MVLTWEVGDEAGMNLVPPTWLLQDRRSLPASCFDFSPVPQFPQLQSSGLSSVCPTWPIANAIPPFQPCLSQALNYPRLSCLEVMESAPLLAWLLQQFPSGP